LSDLSDVSVAMNTSTPPPSQEPGPPPPWKERAVSAEINGRRVNEAIERGLDRSESAVFVCECGYVGCSATIGLSIGAYEEVRTDFDRFLIAPGHEIVEIDRVVEQHLGYLVVIKREAEARERVLETDPRSA
jgi:hypothetical protein